jgi:hypothetical protein
MNKLQNVKFDMILEDFSKFIETVNYTDLTLIEKTFGELITTERENRTL